jgi:hypothetical protein
MEPQAKCMLVLIGATPEGRKELLGLQTGMRESGQSWQKLLVDLKARGLSIAPDIGVGDGARLASGRLWTKRSPRRVIRWVDRSFFGVSVAVGATL